MSTDERPFWYDSTRGRVRFDIESEGQVLRIAITREAINDCLEQADTREAALQAAEERSVEILELARLFIQGGAAHGDDGVYVLMREFCEGRLRP